MADFRLGIDFGTSTTVACLRWPDGRTRPLLFDGSPLLPSAVYLGDERLLVGRDAQHSARVDPARYEPNPKQRIDEGSVLLGSAEVPVTALIAEVLRRVMTEASSVAGGAPLDVTVACPAAWGEHRRRALLDAAAAAGLREPRLVPEPIAAASYFDAVVRDQNRPPGNLVVYDLGAGTFDVSVVARAAGGFEVRVTDGLADIGGLDIDAAIIGFLGAVAEDAVTGDAESVWARLEQPATPQDKRARRQLWDDVRTAKEMLSRSSSTVIFVPLLERDLPLGRAQFERLVRPLLERTVVTTKSAIRRAALPESAPLDVFLVGGASRVPLIATLLHRALGVAPTAIEQPELAVAEGCLVDVQPPGATPHPEPVSGAGFAAAPTSGPPPARPYGPVSPGYGPSAPAYGPSGPSGPVSSPVAPASAPVGYGPPASYNPSPPAPGAMPPPYGPAGPGYAPAYRPGAPGYNPAPPAYNPAGPGYNPAYGQPPPTYGRAPVPPPPADSRFEPVAPPQHHSGAPPWTALVQVLDLAIGESAGFTLRCYLPAENPGEDPDAAFLTSQGQLLVFDDLPDLVNYLRSPDPHDLTDLADWHVVQRGIDPITAEQYMVEAYELDLIVANVGHGTKEWSPDLFVAARDLAVELGNALALRPVLAAFGRGSLLDGLDDTMRAFQGRRTGQWWKERKLHIDEVHTVRDTWRRVVTVIEAAIWPNAVR